MHFASLNFLIFLIIVFSCYWFLVPKTKRSLFLLLCSLIFCLIYVKGYIFLFILMIVITYLVAGYIAKETDKKKIAFGMLLSYLIINLCFFKYFSQIADFFQRYCFSINPKLMVPDYVLPVGLSYITFRLIHYVVEAYRNKVAEASFADFALYVLFFSLFPAGPVERFQRFHLQTRMGPQFEVSEINYGWLRILSGIVKKVFFADNLRRILMPIVSFPQGYSTGILILGVYGIAIQVYLDFSGYSDIAIGSARLFGYKIIENFHYPFFKPNIALFWRSWHISVYSWIRDYFFLPLFGHRASVFKLYLGILASFVVFHLWHKASLSFLVLGVYHGVGMIIWYLFQEIKRRNPIFKIRLFHHRLWRLPSTFLTFSFVSFGFIFFVTDLDKALNFIQAIWH